MEGPVEFIQGIATGTKNLFGSVVGALSKVTGTTSKGLATLTSDKDYQNDRIQRKELESQNTSEIVSIGKNAIKDIMYGVKGVVKKPRGRKLNFFRLTQFYIKNLKNLSSQLIPPWLFLFM
jgi:hypothetical protein